jgi:hypothetical protein
MTRDDITRMAREAGFYNQSADYWDCTTKGIERFAALVAAAEREACAKVCAAQVIELGQSREALVAGICAADIRARGKD